MTLQEIFNKVGNRQGVAALRDMRNIFDHCYNHDPFIKGSAALDEYLLTFGLKRHMHSDQRLQLLIDLQIISNLPEEQWMWMTMECAVSYNLKIIVGIRSK